MRMPSGSYVADAQRVPTGYVAMVSSVPETRVSYGGKHFADLIFPFHPFTDCRDDLVQLASLTRGSHLRFSCLSSVFTRLITSFQCWIVVRKAMACQLGARHPRLARYKI